MWLGCSRGGRPVHTEAVLLPVPCMPWTENSCGWHSSNRHCVVVTAVQAKPHMVLLCWQGRDGSSGSSSSIADAAESTAVVFVST
jgi:hypothetical protein